MKYVLLEQGRTFFSKSIASINYIIMYNKNLTLGSSKPHYLDSNLITWVVWIHGSIQLHFFKVYVRYCKIL